MASAVTFHEMYGTVSKAQLAAYKRYNVSPSDHDMITSRISESDHDEIVAFVKSHSDSGSFRFPFGY